MANSATPDEAPFGSIPVVQQQTTVAESPEPGPAVQVTHCGAEALDEIRSTWEACVREPGFVLNPFGRSFDQADDQYRDQMWREFRGVAEQKLGTGNSFLTVATEDGVVRGFAMSTLFRGNGEPEAGTSGVVDLLAVAPPRRAGIGWAIARALRAHLRELGASVWMANCHASNTGTQALMTGIGGELYMHVYRGET